MFGSNKPAFGSTSSTFGSTSTSLFGQQNKPASSGLFGQSSTANTGSSLFGQKPATSSLFGSPSTTQQTSSLFGGSTQQTANTSGSSLFGQQSKPSLFGASSTPQQQTNTFGSTGSGGGLFGSTTTNTTGGGLFGGSASSAPNGTTVKFNPLVGQDTMMKNGSQQTIQTKNFCISAMKEYEGKSFEELRVEDYMANRKAPGAGTTTGGGLFGGSSTTASTGGTSLFGGSATQQKPSLFGSPAASSSPFGGGTAQSGTSLFGQTSTPQQQSSLFGQKPASGGLFGATTSTAGSTFGAAAGGTTSLFGGATQTATPAFGAQPQQQQSSSLFGGSTFGQTAQQPAAGGGLFGGGTGTTSTFGQTSTAGGGLFGSTTTSTAGGSLFGKPATTQSGGFSFGSTPANTGFGQAAAANTGGGLFGSTAAKPGGLFGSTTTNTGGSLFGGQPAQQSGGLFGASQPAQQQQQGGGLFGGSGVATATTAAVPTTVSMPAPVIVLGSDVNETQLKMAMIEARLAASPYGDSPLLKLVGSKQDTEEKPNPTSATRQMRFLAAKSANQSLNLSGSPSVNGTSRPSSGTTLNGSAMKTSFLSADAPMPGSKIRSSAIPSGQDLNYTASGRSPRVMNGLHGAKPANLPDFANKSILDKTSGMDQVLDRALTGNGNVVSARKSNIKHLDASVLSEIASPRTGASRVRDPDELPSTLEANAAHRERDRVTSPQYSPSLQPREAAIQRVQNLDNQPPPRLNLDSTMDSSAAKSPQPVSPPTATSEEVNTSSAEEVGGAPGGVRLNQTDYYCEPTIRDMHRMVVDGKVVLPNGLTVGRATYGNIFWPGRIELSDVVLDEVVVFRHKEVTVYPDETKKPEEGQGLNREAEVTLERVWHVNKTSKQEIRDPLVLADMGWRDRLERVTANMGAEFKDYRPTTGSWVFRVEHFSKYGLPDDEGDSVVEAPPPSVPTRPRPATAMSERQVQARVQRTRVQLGKGRRGQEEEDEMREEMELEDYEDAENYPQDESIQEEEINLKRNFGLGGGNKGLLSLAEEENSLLNATMNDMEQDGEMIPPEKKGKFENMEELKEETKRVMEQLQPPCRTVVRPAPKCVPPTRRFTGGLKASQSIRTGKSSAIDLGSARGAVARVGWSTGGSYVFSLQPNSNEVYLKCLDWTSDVSKEFICEMLEHNIQHSETLDNESEEVAPRVRPSREFAQLIDSFLTSAHENGYQTEERVWNLCKALFPENREGRWRHVRTDNVCDWFRDQLSDLDESAVEKSRGASVWWSLCAGRLDDAIECAIEENLHQLASMLASFQVDPRTTRQQFEAQISFWETSGCLSHMEVPLLKVYLVMAGRTTVDRVRYGRKERVDCMDGLSWKQAMGVHVWWLRGFHCLENILELAVAQAPPPKEVDDVLFYQLLCLSRDPTHKIESVLDAAADLSTYSLDYHLTWHLWSVLRSVGYSTMCHVAEERLHRLYAEQLANCQLTHLALFVLGHMGNEQSRCFAMRECLERAAVSSQPSDYEKMKEVCGIPDTWIAAARYIVAKSHPSRDDDLCCSLALSAGDLLSAHLHFVEEVAPQAVLTDDIPSLKGFVDRFMKVADKIQTWGQNGQLYADYVELKMMAEDSEENDDKLEHLISTIHARLKAAVFKTPIQRLCAEHISLGVHKAGQVLGQSSQDLPLGSASKLKLLHESV